MRLLQAIIPALLLLRAGAAELPDLAITFGQTNSGSGLEAPSAGDGRTKIASIGGQDALCRADAKSGYLYLVVRAPAYEPGPRDVFVSVEVFDDTVGLLELSYDAQADRPNLQTKYTRATPVLLANSQRWRQVVFHLPNLRMGHGQNCGADFRLVLGNHAVRRVAVSPHPPQGYDPNVPVDAETLRQFSVSRPEGMELIFGSDAVPVTAAVYKALGVSSIESYVDWAGVEPEEGKWDWSKWDQQVAILQNAKLKWVPFLVAGPAYATPLWFQHSPKAHVYRCLEHGQNSAVQSLFNTQLRPQIARFVQAFARQYGSSNVIESLLLGVTGIYGESIYPAGPEGGWTASLTGKYHNHAGWWAGDELAVAAFREAMSKKYQTVGALNQAWELGGAGRRPALASFAEVKTFLPNQASNDRARADLVEWYQQTMTDWAAFWVRTVREAFPKTEIYLCTGGNGDPMLGADFTAQVKAVAPSAAGVRITNEASDYAQNFTLTREVASATRFYGTFCSFEPASGVTPAGNVARGLHCYNNNVFSSEPDAVKLYRRNVSWLLPRKPSVEVALYLPRETWAVDPAKIADVYQLSRALRDVTDHDYVTRQSVADGALRGQRILVLAASPVLEPAAAAAMESWVKAGGTLIATTRAGEVVGGRLYDNAAWRGRLFAPASDDSLRGHDLFTLSCVNAPAHWRLSPSDNGHQEWLFGEWQGGLGPQSGGASTRWTGDRPGVFLPVSPGADYALRLSAFVPREALPGGKAVVVRLNGRDIGRIERDGTHEFAFQVPGRDLGTASLARLEMVVPTWKPSEHGNSGDTRSLGIAVRQVEWIRAGAEHALVQDGVLRFAANRDVLGKYSRQVGQGRTILLPGVLPDVAAIARLAASELPEAIDGYIDNRFVTRTDKGVIWYDPAASTISASRPVRDQ